MNNQELFIDQRKIIEEYIRDNYRVYPGYYVWRKESFIDYSWMHYICDDVLKFLDMHYKEDARDILRIYRSDIETCFKCSKTQRSINLFAIALDLVEDLEGLFYE